MWARIAEIVLALYLAISAFIIPGAHNLCVFNGLIALWILIFSLLSYCQSLRKIHLMNLLAIAVLIFFVFVQPNPPPPPIFQSNLATALFLSLFVIIPSQASIPPKPWRQFYQEDVGDNE